MNAKDYIAQLRAQKNEKNIAGMARFGITGGEVLGISIPYLRDVAKKIKKENSSEDRHALAQEFWDSGIHEARILASFVDDPARVTTTQMDAWVQDFDSWDVCDQVCGALFDKTPFIYEKIVEWAKNDAEFVRRAAFASMAWLAVHDKKAENNVFESFFELIERYSDDDRNFVKKAVNRALRQIGKRNDVLKGSAIKLSETLMKHETKAAKWIGSDAYKELSAR